MYIPTSSQSGRAPVGMEPVPLCVCVVPCFSSRATDKSQRRSNAQEPKQCVRCEKKSPFSVSCPRLLLSPEMSLIFTVTERSEIGINAQAL